MRKASNPIFARAALAVFVLLVLWGTLNLHAAGYALWAVVLLSAGLAASYLYTSQGLTAWRYLFPGVAAMAVFVAFPLFYTAQIGFTNYSSGNLLDEERARAYLLEQRDYSEADSYAYVVRGSGAARRIEFTAPDGARWVAPALDTLRAGQPAELQKLGSGETAPADASIDLRELVALRATLAGLVFKLPGGRELRYVGLREFAVTQPLWQAAADGGLRNMASGAAFAPDREAGFFVSAEGERLQPGFRVFTGVANYTRLFGDADIRGPFVSIFLWTTTFAALTVVFALGLGMSLAVLLNWEALRFRGLYRTLLFLPYAVPAFISILVFRGLFNQNFGEINTILEGLFGIRPAWFADPLLAKVMILIVNVWLGYPYWMIICSGLIKSIPADLYEASALAGAGPWTNFRRITAPLVVRPLAPLLVSVFAYNFNNFAVISLLTDGRPDYLNTKLPAGTTDILVSYTYRIAFTDAGQNFGLASAISTLIFLLVAALSLANLKLMQRAEKT